LTSKASPSSRQSTAAECSHGDGDIRCDCGSLIARWTDGAVEIKCRRCKRRLVVQVSAAGRGPPVVL
jgi:hypothetical protein